MKLKVLITGMIYQCDDEKSLKQTMDHLETDKPELCLIRRTTHAFGIVVDVKEVSKMKKVHGMVSRFDLPDVLELMRLKGYSTLKAKVVRVCRDGGWFIVETDAPDDFMNCKTNVPDCWKTWASPDIPLMLDVPCRGDLESVIAYLDAALHCPGEFDVEATVDSLHDLIELSKYDVTRETQQAMKEFRCLIEDSTDFRVHAVLDTLVQAINDMGSEQRQEEFDEVYYQSLLDSDEATDMINAWYSSFAYTKADDITLEEIRRDKLRQIEQSLQSLPDDLYRQVDRKGRLLHLLLYKAIPYEKYRVLMSALVMRDHLLDELETIVTFTADDAIDVDAEDSMYAPDPLDTSDAWRLWDKAQAKGWVDTGRQPLVSQKKAAILASVIADILHLKPRWAPFEMLWSIPGLANKLSQAQMCAYYSDSLHEYERVLM